MTTLALHPPASPRPGPRGPAVGLGISLLVHAAVLAWLMRAPAPRPADEGPVARMQVRIVPARPAPPPQPQALPLPARPAPAAAPRPPARRQLRPRPPAPASAREAPPVESVTPSSPRDVFAMPPAPSTPAADQDAAPVVDLAAARAAARQIAREDGRNLVALPARKPVVDPNADRQVVAPIEAARRGHCETAYSGMGLLAVIPLIKDAVTGTGCRW